MFSNNGPIMYRTSKVNSLWKFRVVEIGEVIDFFQQKSDNILPENISSLWRWLKFFGPKKKLIDSVTA